MLYISMVEALHLDFRFAHSFNFLGSYKYLNVLNSCNNKDGGIVDKYRNTCLTE